MKKPPLKDGFVCLGVITGAHGIKGEIKLQSYTNDPLDIATYPSLCMGDGTPVTLSKLRVTPKAILSFIEGVTTRNESELLRGTYLYAARDELPDLENDEVYLTDLEGLHVIYEDGTALGHVKEVFVTAAHPVLTIQTEAKEVMIPYTEKFVLDITSERELILTQEAKEFEEI